MRKLTPEQKERQKAYLKAWREKNKEKIKADAKIRSAEWYEKNKERALAKSKARYIANPGRRKVESAVWYQKNKERRLEVAAKWLEKNQDRHKVAVKNWNKKHPEKLREYKVRHREKYGDKKRAYGAAYRAQNSEFIKAIKAAYRKKNPGAGTADSAKRRAAFLRAKPKWADEFFISEIYDLCARRNKSRSCGVHWHVDHIVPLKSKFVCGLHVEHNLRVIPGFENMSKGNRRWPQMP